VQETLLRQELPAACTISRRFPDRLVLRSFEGPFPAGLDFQLAAAAYWTGSSESGEGYFSPHHPQRTSSSRKPCRILGLDQKAGDLLSPASQTMDGPTERPTTGSLTQQPARELASKTRSTRTLLFVLLARLIISATFLELSSSLGTVCGLGGWFFFPRCQSLPRVSCCACITATESALQH